MAIKVLCVDDDEDIHALANAVMGSLGWDQVLSATNGADALQIARADKPDLILLDLVMPAMDGWEVITDLRNDRALHKIPVIMLTAIAQASVRRRAVQAGADDFLPKPFKPADLQKKIQDVAKKRGIVQTDGLFGKARPQPAAEAAPSEEAALPTPERMRSATAAIEEALSRLRQTRTQVEQMSPSTPTESPPAAPTTGAAPAPAAATSPASGSSSEGGAAKAKSAKQLKILCVDDDDDIQTLMANSLGRQPWANIITATNGDEAMEKTRLEKPDLILLDIVMPVKDGWETAVELKNDRKLFKIPMIMLTAINQASVRRRAIQAGAEDFLTKPFKPEELMQRVTEVIKNKKLLTAGELSSVPTPTPTAKKEATPDAPPPPRKERKLRIRSPRAGQNSEEREAVTDMAGLATTLAPATAGGRDVGAAEIAALLEAIPDDPIIRKAIGRFLSDFSQLLAN